MKGRCAHWGRTALAGLVLLALITGSVLAQSTSSPAPPPNAVAAPAATLRLTQVVPRLPTVHFFALAQDEAGTPVRLQSSELSALIGSTNAKVDLTQEAKRIAVVFLIDISKSLRPQQFDLFRASVLAWIDSLGPGDSAAIVTLGSAVNTVQDFTTDKAALTSVMRQLAPRDQQTLLYQGLIQAIDLSRRLDVSLPLRRAIVVLTDGLDDQQGGASRQEVVDKLSVDPTPIYGIGASAQRSAAVDEALKDFSGLVRLSGGDYRRVDIKSLDKGYFELRRLVSETTHLTATCPSCPPDGSTMVVRLLMSQGPTRLSSGSVTARLVGSDGRIVPAKPPTPPPPVATPDPPPKPPEPPPAVVDPPHPPVVINTKEPEPPANWSDRLMAYADSWIGWFRNLPLLWRLALGLAALVVLAGICLAVWSFRRAKETQIDPQPTCQDIQPPSDSVQVSSRLVVPPGTQQNKRRLRLYPIGENELAPIDVLFEEALTVGRSPESDICINNDGQVSAEHCTLSPKGETILVEDAGSRNGTRINGVPIKPFIHAEPDSILGVWADGIAHETPAGGDPMRVIPGNAQHIGDRDSQQDAFGFSSFGDRSFERHGGVMMVLCDGMGGLANGAAASRAAVDAVLSGYNRKQPDEDIAEALNRIIMEAHQAVCIVSGEGGTAGTTIVVAVVWQDRLYWASLGDSRLYLCREGAPAAQLTEDHNVAMLLQQRVARGQSSEKEAATAPDREALTDYLGSPNTPQPQIRREGLPLRIGDRIVACSDGLYRGLAPEAIAATSRQADPMSAAEQMVEAVLRQKIPHQDNLTVALLEVAPDRRVIGWPAFLTRDAIIGAGSGFVVASAVYGGLLYLGVLKVAVRQQGAPAAAAAPPNQTLESLIGKAPKAQPVPPPEAQPEPALDNTQPQPPQAPPSQTPDATAPPPETPSTPSAPTGYIPQLDRPSQMPSMEKADPARPAPTKKATEGAAVVKPGHAADPNGKAVDQGAKQSQKTDKPHEAAPAGSIPVPPVPPVTQVPPAEPTAQPASGSAP